MKCYNIKLLRIFFRNSNFTQEEENKLHYLYHQISLLLIVEIGSIYNKKIKSIIVSFGNKEEWLKYYKEDNIPNFHWYVGTGSASVIFDYDRFYKLEFEERKKMVFEMACESIYNIADKGRQFELMQVIDHIIKKYQDVKQLNTNYVALEQSLDYKGEDLLAKVIFQFNQKIKICLLVLGSQLSGSEIIIDEFDYGYIEWLVTAFKKIEIKENFIYLTGSKELDYLPFKISMEKL